MENQGRRQGCAALTASLTSAARAGMACNPHENPMKGKHMDPITLFAAAAFGAIIGQGNHQMDGFRDTGCDASAQVAVISDRTGEVLYWNNATCPTPSGPSDAVASAAPAPVEPDAPDEINGQQ